MPQSEAQAQQRTHNVQFDLHGGSLDDLWLTFRATLVNMAVSSSNCMHTHCKEMLVVLKDAEW